MNEKEYLYSMEQDIHNLDAFFEIDSVTHISLFVVQECIDVLQDVSNNKDIRSKILFLENVLTELKSRKSK